MSYTSELIKALDAHKIEMRRALPDRIGRWAAIAFGTFADDYTPASSEFSPQGIDEAEKNWPFETIRPKTILSGERTTHEFWSG